MLDRRTNQTKAWTSDETRCVGLRLQYEAD